jgi:hypothetical protein
MCQLPVPAALPPGTYWIGGWVDSSAGLDDVEEGKLENS